MTALPPPAKDNSYSRMGLEIGAIYGLASIAVVGAWALLFVLVGYLIGKLFDD